MNPIECFVSHIDWTTRQGRTIIAVRLKQVFRAGVCIGPIGGDNMPQPGIVIYISPEEKDAYLEAMNNQTLIQLTFTPSHTEESHG